MKEFIYKAEKTICKTEKIENNYTIKVRLFDFEAKMLLEKGVNVYEEITEFDGGGYRKIYFIYCNIDKLASIAQ